MIRFALAASLAAALACTAATPAAAQAPAGTEKLGLKGKKGESLFRPGFQVGEYTGGATAKTSSVNIAGFHTSDKAKVDFNMQSPTLGAITGACAGGESRTGLGWITFDKDDLQYACSYAGAGAPAGASLTLALARGSWKQTLQQPQRAGELRWGSSVIRAQTRRVGGLPWAGGRVMGYVFTKDGKEIGALDITVMPTFYLPPKGDPDRDAVAVLGASLFLFQDPANQNR